jgi:arylsulfatase A-like enzyme
MRLLHALCLFVATTSLTAPVAQAAEKKAGRPNILFLLADDQRPDTIAAFGNPVIKTPHVDSIVRRGFRFSRAYCMGAMGGAVCVPSRAMINSGRTLFRVKTNLDGVTVLPELLRKNGYATFGTGKWHNQPPAFLRGFEQGKAVFFGGMSNHIEVPLVDVTPDGKQLRKRIGEKFSSSLFADAAIDFLENHKDNRPFYAYVAFTAIHDPRQAPAGYIDMYDPADVPFPKNFMPQHPFFNGWMIGRDEVLAGFPRTEKVIRMQLAEYYGLMTHMDHEIGRILKTLKATGHDKNTYIVYAADHGLAMGSHGLLGKQNLYEHSMGTPLVFAGPGIPEGRTSDAFAYLFDIYPTLCELTGIKPPAGVEGKSLQGVWQGKQESVRDSVFTAFSKVMRAVRDDRWKLIRYPHINKSQLFDLKSDPLELNDLASKENQAQRVTRMTALLAKWQKDLGDTQPLSSKNPQSAKIDLTGFKRFPDRHQPDWIVEKYFGGVKAKPRTKKKKKKKRK